MSQPLSPGSLDRALKLQVQQLELALVRQLKELRFKQALRTAESVLQLDPSNTRVQEFVPLLQEKVSLDDGDSSSGSEGEDTEGAVDGEQAEQGAGSQDQDSDSDEDDSSTDEDDDEDETSSSGSEEGAGAEEGNKASGGAEAQPGGLIAAHPPARRRWLHDNVPVVAGTGEALGANPSVHHHPEQLVLDSSNSQLSSGQRRRIREDLARSITRIKAQEAARQALANDPLLSA